MEDTVITEEDNNLPLPTLYLQSVKNVANWTRVSLFTPTYTVEATLKILF
jgi:hypothetical protein